MDPIKQALTEELEQKTLSLQKKQAILQRKQPQQNKWLPKIVAVCIAAIALFLFVTTTEQKTQPITATASLGSVDAGIVAYYNNQATREASDLYNGDAYLLRLALENNSRMFYEDSKLTVKNRFLVSELLHYIQEASWQGDVSFSLQPVASIEELVTLAPQIIAELKPQVSFSYMSVADEKTHQWKFYSYDTKAWVGYVVVLALLLMAVVNLWRNKHWIILSCCVLLLVVAAYQPFTKPYQDTAAYDEQLLIEVVSKQLAEMDVKATGEPVLQYAATIDRNSIRFVKSASPLLISSKESRTLLIRRIWRVIVKSVIPMTMATAIIAAIIVAIKIAVNTLFETVIAKILPSDKGTR